MSEIRDVSTPAAPAAIGPYSQARIHGGLVYCSGQIALDPATGEMRGTTAAAQAEQALKNLAAVLAAARSDFARMLKVTIYLASMDDFGAVNEVYARALGAARPARACVEAARLPKDALVEIDCVAVCD